MTSAADHHRKPPSGFQAAIGRAFDDPAPRWQKLGAEVLHEPGRHPDREQKYFDEVSERFLAKK